jgi:phosphatidylserine/phosphatidylglycerophosphate/cardiolipin synthase-like enzyme
LPPTTIETVATVLEDAEPDTLFVRPIITEALVLPRERAIIEVLLIVATQESVQSVLVAAALRSALHTTQALRRHCQLELVWTGPRSGMEFRRTDQALLQVIQSAETELLLVTFAAYHLPLLENAIKQAIERGVHVRFVAESASEGKIAHDAADAFTEISSDIEIMIWPKEKRKTNAEGKVGSLHVKCALADANVLLLSSANLTEYALHLNMEMGVLVQGGVVPRQVHQHFLRLLQQRIIVPR